MERTDDDGGDVREDGVRTHVSVVVAGAVPAEPAEDDEDGSVTLCVRVKASTNHTPIVFPFRILSLALKT